MINGSTDAPVGNMLFDRDGIVWPVAAGASNCAGKGGPARFSRGVIPLDQGNTHGWQIEAANNGVGEPWPQAQIDAYFAVSNALNARFGNQPGDVITHHGVGTVPQDRPGHRRRRARPLAAGRLDVIGYMGPRRHLCRNRPPRRDDTGPDTARPDTDTARPDTGPAANPGGFNNDRCTRRQRNRVGR